MTDVLGGHTKIMMSSLVQTTPHIKSGKLLALGTGGAKRSSVLPDIPTIARRPAGLSRPRIGGASSRRPVRRRRSSSGCTTRLSAAQNSEAVTKQFSSEGASVVRMSPEEFGKFMVSEMNKWERVVKEGGIKAE